MRAPAVLAALLATLLLAACGGSSRLSKADFETHLRRDARLASKALAGASTANGDEASTYARRIVLAQKDLTRAADDLEGITPPADAERDTATIVTGLRFLARQLGRLHHAAVSSSSTEARDVSRTVARSPELRAVTRAVDDLQRKGYDVGGFGR